MPSSRPLLPALALLALGITGFIWTRATREHHPQGALETESAATTPADDGFRPPLAPIPGTTRVDGEVVWTERDVPMSRAEIVAVPLERPGPPVRSRADPFGRFSLSLPPGRFLISASGVGAEPALNAFVSVPPESNVRLQTRPLPSMLPRRVVDSDGAPVPGAEVRVYDARELVSSRVPAHTQRTDAAGRFWSPGYGPRSIIEIHAPGFFDRVVADARLPGGDVSLLPAATIRGTLFGLPPGPQRSLARVAWTAYRWFARSSGELELRAVDRGVAIPDALGGVIIDAPTDAQLVALLPYDSSHLGETLRLSAIRDTERTGPLQLDATRRRSLTMQIKDERSGGPLPGAELSMRLGDLALPFYADNRGVVVVPEAGPGAGQIELSAVGHLSARLPVTAFREQPPELLLPELPRRVAVLGSDATGTLLIQSPEPGDLVDTLLPPRVAFFDARGVARFPVNPAVTSHLTAYATDGRIATLTADAAALSRDPIVLSPATTHSTAGRLVNSRGEGLPGAIVLATLDDAEDALPLLAITGEGGDFTFSRLTSSAYTLHAFDGQGLPLRLESSGLAALESEVALERLEPMTALAPAPASILVLDAQGAPVQGAVVTSAGGARRLATLVGPRLSRALVAPTRSLTDASGRALFPGFDDPEGTLLVESPEGRLESVVPAPRSGAETTATLRPHGTLDISLPDGSDDLGCRLFELQAGARTYRIDAPVRTVSIPHLPVGDIGIQISCERATWRGRATIQAGMVLKLAPQIIPTDEPRPAAKAD